MVTPLLAPLTQPLVTFKKFNLDMVQPKCGFKFNSKYPGTFDWTACNILLQYQGRNDSPMANHHAVTKSKQTFPAGDPPGMHGCVSQKVVELLEEHHNKHNTKNESIPKY